MLIIVTDFLHMFFRVCSSQPAACPTVATGSARVSKSFYRNTHAEPSILTVGILEKSTLTRVMAYLDAPKIGIVHRERG
jgi:hypothetical protein